jgi:hypothetical protein
MCICQIFLLNVLEAHSQFPYSCPYHRSERRAQNVASVRLARRNRAPIQDTSSRSLIQQACSTPVLFVPKLPLEESED